MLSRTTLLLCLIFAGCGLKENADLLLINGRIITVDDQNPAAEAVAIRDGRIIEIGKNETIRSKYVASRQEDLQGASVFPGFIDAHLHMNSLGRLLLELDLTGTASFEAILKLVETKVKSSPKSEWIFGRGWDQNDWAVKEFPTAEKLNACSGNYYVMLKRVDGHAILVNQRVMDAAGITRNTPDPAGGFIIRDTRGNPTGVLVDNAASLVRKVMPISTREDDSLALELAMKSCLEYGLTSVHDAGVDPQKIDLYKNMSKRGKLTARIYAMLDGSNQALIDEYFQKKRDTTLVDNFLKIASVKLYADGALGSRGAALLEPYSDDAQNRGLAVTDQDRIQEITERALENGYQVCTHAIGDRGNRMTLDAYEKALLRTNMYGLNKRLRIEHAQVVNEFDIPRFAKLGVIASVQPTHCTSDMYWAEARVGPKRILGAYAWQRFIKSGAILCNGSDAPVESNNPLWGFYAAITRQDQQGYPEGGWYPDQKMNVMEALKGFTINAAYASFDEELKGSIEKGKLADLVVLDKDITSIEPKEILKTSVILTIVGGKILYRKTP
ncbi:amidohydrolase [bacterium]|nr:amidohydrolase [bacterium]